MANLKEIEQRINAISKTSTITAAMYNIAAGKLRKTSDLLENYYAFMRELNKVLYDVAARQSENMFVKKNEKDTKKVLYIVSTGDKGLAGNYHSQLFKYLDNLQAEHKKPLELFIVGKKGFFYAKGRKFNVLNNEYISSRDDLQTINYSQYIDIIRQSFVDKIYDEIQIIYNHYVSASSIKVRQEVLLPIPISQMSVERKKNIPFEYDSNPDKVLEDLITVYIQSRTFGIMVDSKLSELSSRMIAMKNATDNTREVVKQLKSKYHRVRQQKITSELIDIVNGTL